MKNKRTILIILLFVGLSGGLKTEPWFQTKYAIIRNGEFVNFVKKKYFDCIMPTIRYIPVRAEIKYPESQSRAASLPDETLNAAGLYFRTYAPVSKEEISRKKVINTPLYLALPLA